MLRSAYARPTSAATLHPSRWRQPFGAGVQQIILAFFPRFWLNRWQDWLKLALYQQWHYLRVWICNETCEEKRKKTNLVIWESLELKRNDISSLLCRKALAESLFEVSTCWLNNPEGLTGLALLHTEGQTGELAAVMSGNEDITSNGCMSLVGTTTKTTTPTSQSSHFDWLVSSEVREGLLVCVGAHPQSLLLWPF